MVLKRLSFVAITLVAITAFSTHPRADVPADGARRSVPNVAAARETAGDAPHRDVVSDQGRQARGIYVNAAVMRRSRAAGLVRTLRRAQMDTVVVDLKDSAGNIFIDTSVPELERQTVRRRHRVRREAISELKSAGVYTIARIVCFADGQLPIRRPDLAGRRTRGRRPWISAGTGGTWLDPYNERNHEILVAFAREAEALGFDEVQLDYVRFPVDDATRWAVFPAEDGRLRADALLSFLQRLDGALRIPVGVDVFGLAAYREGDPSGLGQDLVRWAPHVEVISPMLYVNAMRNWHVGQRNRARNLVQNGVSALRSRIGDEVVIRPYLQAFSEGSDEFSPRFIAQQIRGAHHGGSDGFLFWHPGSQYGILERSARRISRLHPFPLRGTAAE